MEFFVKDYKGREWKVDAVDDCDENAGGLWCMVYREDGETFDGYEDDYSHDFCIHSDECDTENYDSVRNYLNEKFGDALWADLYLDDDFDETLWRIGEFPDD